MITTLEHIANIRTGVFAKPNTEGEIVYLQLKYFDENGVLVSNLHPDLKYEDVAEKHLLRQGDVLFATKGSKNFAAKFENRNHPSAASTSFFIISMKESFKNKIIPDFLVWYINDSRSQSYLKNKAIGTSVVSISKKVLEKLEIPIPDLSLQQMILKIVQFSNKEKELKQQIEALREKLIQQQIINSIYK